jgi:hypothetical protein
VSGPISGPDTGRRLSVSMKAASSGRRSTLACLVAAIAARGMPSALSPGSWIATTPPRRSRLRDVVRSRASRPAALEVGRAEAGPQLGIPLVPIADSCHEFNRSPRPAGRALTRPVSAFHLLVVSQTSLLHKAMDG